MDAVFIALCVAATLLGIVVGGFVVYRAGHAKSWESGIITLFQWIFEGAISTTRSLVKIVQRVVRWFLTDDFAIRRRNNSLLLLPEELTRLVDLLNLNPYDFPTVDGCNVDGSDIYCLNLSAFGLTHGYQELNAEQIRQITQRIVSEFWRTTRGFVPPFYISEATENRLTICVPLSTYGKETLQRRIEQAEAMRQMQRRELPAVSPTLEEEVEFPDILGDGEP